MPLLNGLHRLAPGDYNVRFNGWPFRYPYAEYEARGEDLPLCIFATRRTLESTLRSLVLQASPNVEYVLGTVTDLKLSEDGGRVTAVSVRTDAAGVQTIPCDMFVGTLALAAPTRPRLIAF